VAFEAADATVVTAACPLVGEAAEL